MTRPNTRRSFLATTTAVAASLLAGCASGGDQPTDDMGDGSPTTTDSMGDVTTTTAGMGDDGMAPTDPTMAPRAAIDRFSDVAGTLMVRTAMNGLPGPDEPVDFDQGPFITRGLGPEGDSVAYYNFDVQPRTPAPIYVLVREGESTPVADQLNIVDAIPGDEAYNDFWQVNRVTVPTDYETNSLTDARAIREGDYPVTATDTLVNCPVVPAGSTATRRFGDADPGLVDGWYRDQVVSYFQFTEASLTVTDGQVPVSPIFVTFNRNPGEEGGGPGSGFRTEPESAQTHNVVATLPGDAGYSPLWSVSVYDSKDFQSVRDLATASDATILDPGAATVNCPIVTA